MTSYAPTSSCASEPRPAVPPNLILPTQQNRQRAEWLLCRNDPGFFIREFCRIQDERGQWIPFDLWPAQQAVVENASVHRLLIWLKARQLGMTWLALALVLHELIFKPGITALLFSLRDEEAMELLKRLRGMYRRLPPWLQVTENADNGPVDKPKDAAHEWVLLNGSRAKAFPSNRGDSYTASIAVIDEADLIDNLEALLGSVMPTIDAGGRLILLSRVDKGRSEERSPFKRIYIAAKKGENGWHHEFLPWSARPSRDVKWYAVKRADSFSRTGSLDALYEQYPATDHEALAPRSLDKRFPYEWLKQCYDEWKEPIVEDGRVHVQGAAFGAQVKLSFGPAIPGLTVFKRPEQGKVYVLAADTAEGNPTSDDSGFTVLEKETGEEVANVFGKLEPAVLADYCDQVGKWYNNAAVLIERNNHGHAVLLWLKEHSKLQRLCGGDGKEGWNETAKSKALLLATAAESFRNKETLIHSFATFMQLANLEGSTLKAPEGQHDDRAISYCLAVAALPMMVAIKGWKMERF